MGRIFNIQAKDLELFRRKTRRKLRKGDVIRINDSPNSSKVREALDLRPQTKDVLASKKYQNRLVYGESNFRILEVRSRQGGGDRYSKGLILEDAPDAGLVLPTFPAPVGEALQHLWHENTEFEVKTDDYTYINDIANTGTERELRGGSAYSLDGIDGVITIPHSPLLTFGDGVNDSPFTITARFIAADLTATPIFVKYDGVATYEYYLYVTSGDKLEFAITDGGIADRLAVRTTAITGFQGQQLFAVASYDGSKTIGGMSIQIYDINGVLLISNSETNSLGTYTAMDGAAVEQVIGKIFAGSFASATIYDVRVHNTKLTPTKIQLLLDNPANLTGDEVGMWHLDEEVGFAAFDSTGNNLHGVASGGATHTSQNIVSFPDVVGFNNVYREINGSTRYVRTNLGIFPTGDHIIELKWLVKSGRILRVNTRNDGLNITGTALNYLTADATVYVLLADVTPYINKFGTWLLSFNDTTNVLTFSIDGNVLATPTLAQKPNEFFSIGGVGSGELMYVFSAKLNSTFYIQNGLLANGATDNAPNFVPVVPALLDSSTPNTDIGNVSLANLGKAPKDGRLVASHATTFDGVGDHVEFIETELANGEDWSIEGLMFPIESSKRLISGTNADDFIAFDTILNNLLIRAEGSAVISLPYAAGSIVLNQWQQIKVTHNANDTVDLTVNGVLQANLGSYTNSITVRYLCRGNINYSQYRLANMKLVANGTTVFHYPMAEGGGLLNYDISVNRNHGIVTATESAYWANTQDFYHYNILEGFSLDAADGVIARMQGPLSVQEELAIRKFVNSEELAGNWELVDEFFCFSLAGANALIGFKSKTAAPSNSPIFDIEGAHFDGVNQSIDPVWIASVDGINYKQADAFMGGYSKVNNYLGGTVQSALFGKNLAGQQTRMLGQTTPGIRYTLNANGSHTLTGRSFKNDSLYLATKVSDTEVQMVIDGVGIGSPTTITAGVVPTSSVPIGAQDTSNYWNGIISTFIMGGTNGFDHTAHNTNHLELLIDLGVFTTPVLNRFSALSQLEIDSISNFVNQEVRDGNWGLYDEFFCFSLNATDRLIGFKSKTAVNSGTVTFGANGAIFDGTNYLDTTFVPATDGVNYKQSDSLVGAFLFDNIDSAGIQHLLGSRDAAVAANQISIEYSHTSSRAQMGLQAADSRATLASFQTKSLYIATRNGANTTVKLSLDGVDLSITLNGGDGVLTSAPCYVGHFLRDGTGVIDDGIEGAIPTFIIGGAAGFDKVAHNTNHRKLLTDLGVTLS